MNQSLLFSLFILGWWLLLPIFLSGYYHGAFQRLSDLFLLALWYQLPLFVRHVQFYMLVFFFISGWFWRDFKRLLVRLTQSQIAAYNATVGLLINPANIFFTAIYTESPFLCFTLAGFYCLVDEEPSRLKACMFFCLASSTRSNGTLNTGFLAHFIIHEMFTLFFKKISILYSKLSQVINT